MKWMTLMVATSLFLIFSCGNGVPTENKTISSIAPYPKDGADIIVFLNNNSREIDIIKLQKSLDASAFVRYTELISKEQNAEKTNMNFENNLVLPSIDVYLVPKYINTDSIAKIKHKLMYYSIVDTVVSKPIIDDVTRKTKRNITNERRNSLIAKYGRKSGNKLADGKLEIGMTKEMCYAIDINDNDYKISRYKGKNGAIIEEWERDFSNLRGEIDREFGVGGLLDDASAEQIMDFAYAFAESFAQSYTKTSGNKINENQIVNSRFRYKYIKFKNDEIIDLRESGN
jgi:hypothetical protein